MKTMQITIGLLVLLATIALASNIIGPPDDQFDLDKIPAEWLVPSEKSARAADTSVTITLDQSRFPIIDMYIDVLDDQGMPIPGLTESDFCVSQDGQPVGFQVTEEGSQGCETSINLVIDLSTSMRDEIADARAAAHSLVTNMDVFDDVSIVTFGSCIGEVLDFTSDQAALHNFISNNTVLSGSTALFDGIWEGVEMTAPQLGSKAVIAFTDGLENRSHTCDRPPNGLQIDGIYSDDSVLICERANAAGVTIYTLSLGSDAAVAPLEAFAWGTGGYYMHAPSATDMDSLYAHIKQTLCSRYKITFISPDTVQDGDLHEVVVCQGAPSCTPCDTAYYQENCQPVIALDPTTVMLSSQCQPVGGNITICANVIDTTPPLITDVTLYWRISDPSVTSYNAMSMVETSPDMYCATVPGSNFPAGVAGLDYYMTASDGEMTVSQPAFDPQHYPYVITICPNEPPVISDVDVDCSASGDANVVASIVDPIDNVDHAVLYYRAAGTVLYDSTTMSFNSTQYVGTIPSSYTDTGWFDYIIRAWDNYGLMSVYGPVSDTCGSDSVTPTDRWINIYCAEPMLDDVPLSPGDVITAYDPDGVLCGMGQVRANGSYGMIPIYAADLYTDDIDEGADPGDLILLKVNGEEVASDPLLIWTENGAIFETCVFKAERCMHFDLDAGWHLISWNVAYSAAIDEAIADFVDCVDVVLSFDRGGQTYDPLLPVFSNLNSVDFYHGYWLRLSCPVSFDICGGFISTDDAIQVYSGWNLVSYWPEDILPIEEGFASLLATDNLLVAYGYDNGAADYVPGDPFHQSLDYLYPGLGYWVKVINDDLLIYPGYGGSSPHFENQRSLATSVGVIPSRNWMSIYGANLEVDGAQVRSGGHH